MSTLARKRFIARSIRLSSFASYNRKGKINNVLSFWITLADSRVQLSMYLGCGFVRA